MLRWLRERFRSRKMSDPVLGELTYVGGYWEGAGVLGPAGAIEWFVDAGPEGPGEAHRALLRSIEERYERLLPAALAAALPHAQPWSDEALDLSSLGSALKLSALDLPAAESDTMSWALYFDSRLRSTPSFVVRMKGWSPTGEVEVSD